MFPASHIFKKVMSLLLIEQFENNPAQKPYRALGLMARATAPSLPAGP